MPGHRRPVVADHGRVVGEQAGLGPRHPGVVGVGQGTWATGEWVALDVGVDLDIVAIKAN